MYWLPYSSHTSHHPSQTPCLPWISYTTQKLMLNSCKNLQNQYEAFHTFLWHFFPSLKHNFMTYHSSKVSDCIFEIHQLWQSGFSRVYSNCCCSCSFEAEIIKIGQSSYKMYRNNILNFPESTTILNAHTKKVWKLICPSCIYILIFKRQTWCNGYCYKKWKQTPEFKFWTGLFAFCFTLMPLWKVWIHLLYSKLILKNLFKNSKPEEILIFLKEINFFIKI